MPGSRDGAAPGDGVAVVLDFDGTITEDDMLDRVCRELGDPVVYAEVDAALERGEIRLVDDIERKLRTVRRPLEEVVAWVRAEARIRPGFDELLHAAEAAGHRAVVVTSSLHELVEPVLGVHAHRVELVAGRLQASAHGLRADLSQLELCDVCGEPCKRAAIARLAAHEVVYVGDGYSDRCPAGAADTVFARDGLARYLDEHGVAYKPFADLHEVARGLELRRAA